MKGIILAGGTGTRLYPLTAVTNKHLVPVGDLPMIEYPLHTLMGLGVDSVSVVTGGEHFQDIARYFGTLHPDLNFSYHYQPEAGGIAQALSLTEHFVNDKKIAVILGDNIFEDSFPDAAKKFENSSLGAMFFLKKVKDPERFGVAELKGDKIMALKEKPKHPMSDLAVTGLYFYSTDVFSKIKKLIPSARGEYEITEVNDMYVKENNTSFHILEGFWSDAGTFTSRDACQKFVKKGLEKRVIEFFNLNLGFAN